MAATFCGTRCWPQHFVGRVALDPPMRGLAELPGIGAGGASVRQVGADLPYVLRGRGDLVRDRRQMAGAL